jgi:type II secretion system protein I
LRDMPHSSLKMNDHRVALTEHKKGFALVEILIAVAILSIVLLSVISGVTSSIYVITGMRSYTKAMLIARTRMNEFILNNMRGTDIKHEQVREYPGFDFSRVTRRFEHPWLEGPIPVNITDIIVSWSEKGREREYTLSYIYQSQ